MTTITQYETGATEMISLQEQNDFIKFNDKKNLNKWFKYKTNYPEKDALHCIYFTYGIVATIEQFNTTSRTLNPLFHNKYLVEVVIRRESGPHQNVVPFTEHHAADTLEQAIEIAEKYIAREQEAANKAQINHMATFKTNQLT